MGLNYDELDQETKDRLSEVVEDLKADTRFIDDVIDAAGVPNTNEAVDRVIKFIRDASDAIIDL